MEFHVVTAARAAKDLHEIGKYIAKDNVTAARKLALELSAQARRLRRFPRLGRIVPEFGLPETRELICGSYRIIYQIEPHSREIQVLRFWHAARGAPRIN